MNSSDKGSFAEEWYRAIFSPNSSTHVRLSGASGMTRFPDLVDIHGSLQDIKHIEGALSQRELDQFGDYVDMIGTRMSVEINGTPQTVQVQTVRYAFLNPDGVSANAAWMHRNLRAGVAFEIFNQQGDRLIVNSVGVFRPDGTQFANLDFLIYSTQLNAWLR
ncbi:MAG: hypothetical protein NW226_22975 [Microscillaceae bacterium]|nr:hypothetical protein [Microscillaceae bacterium]